MEVAELHPNVVAITAPWGNGSHVVLYLIKGERYALVDTGAYDTPARAIAPALAERGLTLADIDLILNTHGHADHAGGNHAMQSSSSAKVFISKNELSALVHGGPRAKADLFRPLRDVFDKAQFKTRFDENILNSGGRFRVHHLVDDGDVVDLGAGVELKVVSLPGHTPGTVGYFWEKEGMLFAGDAMIGRGSRAGGLPIICDSEAYNESAARLLKMPVRMLCLAHKYSSFQLPSQSVRSGTDIQTYLEECIYVNGELRAAAGRAVQSEPSASLWRQGERLLEELPPRFEPLPLQDLVPSLWSAMGVYSFIWKARANVG